MNIRRAIKHRRMRQKWCNVVAQAHSIYRSTVLRVVEDVWGDGKPAIPFPAGNSENYAYEAKFIVLAKCSKLSEGYSAVGSQIALTNQQRNCKTLSHILDRALLLRVLSNACCPLHYVRLLSESSDNEATQIGLHASHSRAPFLSLRPVCTFVFRQ